MKKLVVEFIGTFFVMFVAGNAVIGQQPLGALAIGAALMIATYAGAAVSGAHFNPAVSLAMWRRGKLNLIEVPQYVAVQIVAALAGAWLASVVQESAITTYVTATLDALQAKGRGPSITSMGLAEFLGTFMLVYAVLQVTTEKKTQGNSYFGFVIGVTAATGLVAVSNISGGMFNPALYAGLCLLGAKKVASILIFWVAQFLAGWLAAEVFRFTNLEKAVAEPAVAEPVQAAIAPQAATPGTGGSAAPPSSMV